MGFEPMTLIAQYISPHEITKTLISAISAQFTLKKLGEFDLQVSAEATMKQH